MDVDIAVLEVKLTPDKEALHQAHGRIRGFFHHVADLAGEVDLSGSFHGHGFDEEDFSSRLGPGQSGHNPGRIVFQYLIMIDLFLPQIVLEVILADHHLFFGFISCLTDFFFLCHGFFR